MAPSTDTEWANQLSTFRKRWAFLVLQLSLRIIFYDNDELSFFIFLAHGRWSDWSDWTSLCSIIYHQNTTTRTRTCTNPPPTYGGRPCEGHDSETVHCFSTYEHLNMFAVQCCSHLLATLRTKH